MEVEMIRKTYHMCLPFEIVNKLLCQGKMYKNSIFEGITRM